MRVLLFGGGSWWWGAGWASSPHSWEPRRPDTLEALCYNAVSPPFTRSTEDRLREA